MCFRPGSNRKRRLGVGRNVEQTKEVQLSGLYQPRVEYKKPFDWLGRRSGECFTGDSSDPCQGQVEKQETLIGEAQFLLVYKVLRGKSKQMRK